MPLSHNKIEIPFYFKCFLKYRMSDMPLIRVRIYKVFCKFCWSFFIIIYVWLKSFVSYVIHMLKLLSFIKKIVMQKAIGSQCGFVLHVKYCWGVICCNRNYIYVFHAYVLQSYVGTYFCFFVGQSCVDLWLDLSVDLEVSH